MLRKFQRFVVGAGIAAVVTVFASPAQAQMSDGPKGRDATITGTVIDLSCKFGFGLTGNDHRMCAQVCADNGIPLVILTDDGRLYIPVSAGMPGSSENERLKEFAEQKVRVRGKVFEAGGAQAVRIESVRRV